MRPIIASMAVLVLVVTSFGQRPRTPRLRDPRSGALLRGTDVILRDRQGKTMTFRTDLQGRLPRRALKEFSDEQVRLSIPKIESSASVINLREPSKVIEVGQPPRDSRVSFIPPERHLSAVQTSLRTVDAADPLTQLMQEWSRVRRIAKAGGEWKPEWDDITNALRSMREARLNASGQVDRLVQDSKTRKERVRSAREASKLALSVLDVWESSSQKIGDVLAEIGDLGSPRVRRAMGSFRRHFESGMSTGAITHTDDTGLVLVNVGTQNGVAKGQFLDIRRGAAHIGTIRIDTVSENAAAGSVTMLSPGPQLAVGDRVIPRGNGGSFSGPSLSNLASEFEDAAGRVSDARVSVSLVDESIDGWGLEQTNVTVHLKGTRLLPVSDGGENEVTVPIAAPEGGFAVGFLARSCVIEPTEARIEEGQAVATATLYGHDFSGDASFVAFIADVAPESEPVPIRLDAPWRSLLLFLVALACGAWLRPYLGIIGLDRKAKTKTRLASYLIDVAAGAVFLTFVIVGLAEWLSPHLPAMDVRQGWVVKIAMGLLSGIVGVGLGQLIEARLRGDRPEDEEGSSPPPRGGDGGELT